MGNVHLFQGNFENAIENLNKAIELAGGNYPAAEHDKKSRTDPSWKLNS
ncbi:MAG: tetratricopeptide repeat protein [Candidatus Bathyarchaeota archaeon]|nr:tetratricopeptide repeat protein [Candidatus Bathyarchaeota archaeon]